MGNSSSSSRTFLRTAAGIAENAIRAASTTEPTDSINIRGDYKLYLKTSPEGCFDCPSGVIRVCEREQSVDSYLIVDPEALDEDRFRAYVKAEIVGNLKSIEANADFQEYLDRIKGPLGIETAADLANVFCYAIDEYLTVQTVYEDIHASLKTTDDGGSEEYIVHVAGRVPRAWCSVAQSNLQNLNTVILATSISDTLANFAPARLAIEEAERRISELNHAERFVRKMLVIFAVVATVIFIILIVHLLRNRWRLQSVLCPKNATDGLVINCR